MLQWIISAALCSMLSGFIFVFLCVAVPGVFMDFYQQMRWGIAIGACAFASALMVHQYLGLVRYHFLMEGYHAF